MKKVTTTLIAIPSAIALSCAFTGCSSSSSQPQSDQTQTNGSTPQNGPSSKQGGDVNQAARAKLPKSIRDAGTISIAINPDIPPVKFLNDKNQIDGLVVDLLKGAAKRLGIAPKFPQTSFDALIPGVASGRYDMFASSGDFKERQAKITFIDYLNVSLALVVPKGNPKHISSPNDLCGLTVAFVAGTQEQMLVSQHSKKCKNEGKAAVHAYGVKDTAAADLALRSGQADADWTTTPDAGYRMEKHPGTYTVASTGTPSLYGIGFPKAKPGLVNAFRQVMLDMVHDGEYSGILKKWGQSKFGVPKLTVNAGKPQAYYS